MAVLLPLFSPELVFLGANLLKVNHRGYVPHRRHIDHNDVDLAEGVSACCARRPPARTFR